MQRQAMSKNKSEMKFCGVVEELRTVRLTDSISTT